MCRKRVLPRFPCFKKTVGLRTANFHLSDFPCVDLLCILSRQLARDFSAFLHAQLVHFFCQTLSVKILATFTLNS